MRSVSPTQYAPGPAVITGNSCVSEVIGCTVESRITDEPRTMFAMMSAAIGFGTKPCRLSFRYPVSEKRWRSKFILFFIVVILSYLFA